MRTDHATPPLSALRTMASALLCLVLASGAVSSARAGAKDGAVVRIAFRSSNLVRGENFTLGDVAKVQAADSQQRRRIAGLVLGKSPNLGYRTVFRPGQLQTRLQDLGIEVTDESVRIPNQVVVERESQDVDLAKLDRTVREELLAQMPVSVDGLILEKVQLPRSIELPAGVLTQTVDFRFPKRTVGSVPFTINLAVDGAEQRRVTGSLSLDVEVETLQALKPLERGDPVTPQACRFIVKRLSKLPRAALREGDLLAPLTARRRIQPGEVLSWSNVEKKLFVRRGQPVRMVLESKSGLHISTFGKAKDNGSLGDQIEVVNAKSGKKVWAVVSGAQTVIVPF